MKSWNAGPEEIRDFFAVVWVSLEFAMVLAKFEQYLGWTDDKIFLLREMPNKNLKVLRYSMFG